MARGWAPPGQMPDPTSWNFDLRKGWQPPGSTHDAQQVQFGLGQGAAPGPDAPPWSLLTSPPGVPAPKDAINYTPKTGEMHPPGQMAPTHHTNLSMVPADPLVTAESTLRRAPDVKKKNAGIMQEIKGLLSGLGANRRQPSVGVGAAGPYGAYPTPFSAVPPTDDETGTSPSGYPSNAPGSSPPQQSPAGGPAPDDHGCPPGQVWNSLVEMCVAASKADETKAPIVNQSGGFWTQDASGEWVWRENPKSDPVTTQGPVPPGYETITMSDGSQQVVPSRRPEPTRGIANVTPAPQPGYNIVTYTDGSQELIPAHDPPAGSTDPHTQLVSDGKGGFYVVDMTTGQVISRQSGQQGEVTERPGPNGSTLLVDGAGNVVQVVPGNSDWTNVGNDIYGVGPDGKPEMLLDNPDRMTLSDGSVVEIGPDGQMTYVYRAPQRMTVNGRIVELGEDGTSKVLYEEPVRPNQPWMQRELHKDNPDLYPDAVGSGEDPMMPEMPEDTGTGATLQKSLRPTQNIPTGATMSASPEDVYGMFPGGDPMVGTGAAAPDIHGASSFVSPVDPGEVVGTGHRFGEQVDLEGTHKGLDLQAVRGTPVKAPVSGIVDRIDNEPEGLGIQVVITDEQGKEHVLAHLDEVMVEPGQDVSAGTVVGAVGDSGAGATGPHLDYRRRLPNGDYEDPSGDLGPLAQMPRADEGAPIGVGADFDWDSFYENLPGHPSGGPPNFSGNSGGGGSGFSGPGSGIGSKGWLDSLGLPSGSTTPGGYTTSGGGGGAYGGMPGGMTSDEQNVWLIWKQLQEAVAENARQAQMAQQRIDQDAAQHQDLLKYQQDTLRLQQQQMQVNAELQRQQMLMSGIVAPIMQAAYNHPWLQSLAGMTPALGQPMGPNGSPSARLGAGKGMLADLAEEMGIQMDGSTGFNGDKPGDLWGQNGKNRVAIAAQNPETGQTQGITHHQNYLDIDSGEKVKRAGLDTQTGDDLLSQGIAVGGITQHDALKGKIDWETYAQMTPYQRAALRTDVELRAPETGMNWGDYTMKLREGWAGKKRDPVTAMPEMTQLHAASQNPEQRIGTEQLADTFGEPAGQFWGNQAKTWSKSAGSNVFQEA